MAKGKKSTTKSGGSWNRPTSGVDRKKKADELRKSALGSKGKKRAKRYTASQYVNFDARGNFAGYKKGKPKGYVYLPGSRYLSKTSDLRLVGSYSGPEQRAFVRKNRGAVERAIEAASKEGAFKDFGMNRQVGGYNAADFDLSKGGKKFQESLRDAYKSHAGMRSRPLRGSAGPTGRRARTNWSFAFGQDGHVK